MTRQLTAVLTFVFALALVRPAAAQVTAAEGATAADEHEVRVKFDAQDAKGEIKCKKGKLRNGKVVFRKCAHDKLDKYEDVAVRKKIVASKEKYATLSAKKKMMVKKVAFYDSASKKIRDDLKELGEAKKDDIEYKKLQGAKEKVDKNFEKSLADCAKEADAEITCPSKD